MMGIASSSRRINNTLPRWIEGCKSEVRRSEAASCAMLWASRPRFTASVLTRASTGIVSDGATQDGSGDGGRQNAGAAAPATPPILLFTLFKNMPRANLIRFIEYHLLLGVDHVVLVDNSCGASAEAARQTLAPYVSRGLVTLHSQFVCTELRAMMFMHNFRGGSSMARQLAGSSLGLVSRDALIVSLDDDEYLVLGDPSATLQDVRRELFTKQVCAVTLPWRVFGSSGHKCQPEGPLIGRFVRRARTEKEVRSRTRLQEAGALRAEARRRHLNTPYGGKPIFMYAAPTSPQCGTHWCEDCNQGLTNCALPEGPGQLCEQKLNLTGERMWINHYAFQSEQHWELKKRRGRTNQLPSRTGGVPGSYERIFDAEGYTLLRTRVEKLEASAMQNCMRKLFFD